MSARTEKEQRSGPLTVGVCDMRTTGSSVTTSHRVRIFYPTVHDVTAPPAQFFPPSVDTWFLDRSVRSVLRFGNIQMASVFAWPLSYIAKLPLPAQATGPVLPTESKLPVMLFTHGLGGAIGNYSSFCIDMASHGWIVFAIEHADGSSFEALVYHNNKNKNQDNNDSHRSSQQKIQESHSFIPYARSDGKTSIPEFRAPQLETRCKELATLMSLLSGSKNKSVDPTDVFIPLRDSSPVPYNLFERMDMSHIVIAGHSFGAATALMYATRMETPPVALICMDPWMLPLEGRVHEFPIPKGTHAVFIDMDDPKMAENMPVREHVCKQDTDDGAILDAVTVVDGLHNDSSDFPLRIPHWIAAATNLTKFNSDPLRLLKAQNNAACHFLRGLKSWTAFTERVRNGQEDSLRMASV